MGKTTFQTVKGETLCCHYMDYSFQIAARVLLYTSSDRQDSTYHVDLVIPVVKQWAEWETWVQIQYLLDKKTLIPINWSYI